MLRKVIFATFVFFATATLGLAQAGNSNTTPPPEVKNMVELKEEKVEGVLALAGYLGNKLMKEMSTRMNLDDSVNSIPAEPVKVIIKVGVFQVERIENR